MVIKASKERNIVQFIFDDNDWARSTFPDPLITFDFDEKDNLVAVEFIGSKAEKILDALDPRRLIEFI